MYKIQLRRRVTRRGGGGRSPLPFFQKLEKNALILGKKAYAVVICWLNFLFKMQFLRLSRRKKLNFFPAGQNFFLVLYMIVYQIALIPRKHPCPKKPWLRACYVCFNFVMWLMTMRIKLKMKSGTQRYDRK